LNFGDHFALGLALGLALGKGQRQEF